MCGICGIVASKREVEWSVASLQRMTNTLRHRGPDDDGVATFAGGGFGFRRLSIIDVAGSHQPLTNEDGNITLVCNGEIYNFKEVRDELQAKGHLFKTNGDAEVAVHAYEEWGEAFLQHLRGMFALALWDASKERLILARDRLGIKPLFYARLRDRIIFGSEIKAILASGDVARDIDRGSIDCYLSLNYIPAPATIYRDVKKLPPATYLVYDRREIRKETYWSPPAQRATWSMEEDVSTLADLLEDSISSHLQSDVPYAFFLSGGVDSSALVALAARSSPQAPTTFSIGFETQSHNELEYARIVADAFKCDHHEAMVRADAASVLPRIVTGFDEPFADPSAVPTYYISQVASEHVKVVIGGDGGDELFVGYEWTRRQKFIDTWHRVPSSVRRVLANAFDSSTDAPSRLGKVARFLGDSERAALDGYVRRMSCVTPAQKERLYRGGMRDMLSGHRAHEIFGGYFNGNDAIASMNRADLHVYLPDDCLCKVDRMTMLNSIEGRVPLLDDRIVDFALRLPTDAKLHGLTSKYILKKTVHDMLPAAIMKQRKQGFAPPIAKWMREDLHEDAKRLLLSKRCAERELFQMDTVRDMLEAHRSGKSNVGYALWNLLILELWFILCVDDEDIDKAQALTLGDL